MTTNDNNSSNTPLLVNKIWIGIIVIDSIYSLLIVANGINNITNTLKKLIIVVINNPVLALTKDLKVMDQTAITLCKDNDIDLCVFNMQEDGNIAKACDGQKIGTTISGGK